MFKKALIVVFIMALCGTAAGIFIALKLSNLYSPNESGLMQKIRVVADPKSFFPGQNDLYILVLGTDYNYTDKDIMFTKGSRSDTMLLIHLDLNDKAMKILSVPRDTRVYIPGDCYHGDCYDKINAAYSTGGPKRAEHVVANLVGIPIDYYIRIKEQGLKDLVNAMGGIDLDVEKDMNYDDNWGHLHIHLKKGWQHLDGDHAAQYARFRHDEMGDYGRIERQQQVIKAIAKRLENPMVLLKINNIVHVGKENVDSDLSFDQLLALANLYKGTKMSGLQTYTYPTHPQDIFEFGSWASYVIADPDKAKDVMAAFTSDAPPAVAGQQPAQGQQTGGTQSSGLTVEVLNGSGIPGAAQQVAEKLKSNGFVVSRVGNADRFDYDKTQIVDHTGKGEAMVVARLFNGEETQTLSVPQDPRPVDVTVIVGKEQATSQTVTQ